jgi:hypothetical protein
MIDLSQLELECSDLRRLLSTTVPRYARERQAISLAASSALIAQFWQHVGWFDGFDGALARPDDASPQSDLLALLERWRAEDMRGDGSYDGVLDVLPESFSVVALGDEAVTLADLSGGELDPPVVVLYGPSTDAEEPSLERLPQNYLATVTDLLLESVQFETAVKGSLTARRLTCTEVLPTLVPGSLRADDVWLLALAPPREPASFELRVPNVAQLVSFLEQVDPSQVVGFACHASPARRARQLPLPTSLRRIELAYPAPATLYVGELAGASVLVTQPNDPRELFTIHCDSAQLAAVDGWFATNRP